MKRCMMLFATLFATATVHAQTPIRNPTGIPKFPLPSSPIDIEGPARPGYYVGESGTNQRERKERLEDILVVDCDVHVNKTPGPPRLLL